MRELTQALLSVLIAQIGRLKRPLLPANAVYGLVKGSFLARGAEGSAGAGLFFLGGAARPAVPDHPGKAHGRTHAVGRGMICSPGGAGAVDATPLSAAPDLVTSCSATDWPAELDGGPGGSEGSNKL